MRNTNHIIGLNHGMEDTGFDRASVSGAAKQRKTQENMNKISWRLILELVEAVVEAILRIFGGKSDKEQNKK